jgi:hypothetical protein
MLHKLVPTTSLTGPNLQPSLLIVPGSARTHRSRIRHSLITPLLVDHLDITGDHQSITIAHSWAATLSSVAGNLAEVSHPLRSICSR